MQHVKTFIWILGFVSMTGMSYGQTGWSFQNNPLPNGTLLGKIQFVSPTEGWISADKGDLLHTTDAGATWNRVVPFPNDTVFSMSDPAITMWWVNQTHGWKINWFGTSLSDVHGAVIHKTTDGGSTWEKKVLSTAVGDMGLQVQFVDENNGWASIYNFSSGNMSTMRSTDGGNNWSLIGTAGVFYFVDANNGWMITSAGVLGSPANNICHTTNGGADWSVQYTDTAGNIGRIQFTDLNNGWVVGDNSKILKTTNGGSNWTPITNTGISSGSKSKCVFFLDANTGWIGSSTSSSDRTIFHTTNGGSSWTMQNPQTSGPVFSIFFWDANNGWFTGDQCVQNCNLIDSLQTSAGTIGHTTNGGTTGVAEEKSKVPSAFSLSQNYPDPFNPTTAIRFALPRSSYVSLKIFNLLGQEVAVLVNGELPAGYRSVTWDASNVPSGIYFYRITAGTFTETKKLLLLR